MIGGGITGVAAALHLRRDGWDVTLIDPLDAGDPGQTSYGNAGLLARSAILPVQAPGLIWRAPRMLLDRDSPLFLRPGEGAALARALPGVGRDYAFAAVFRDHGWVTDPAAYVRALCETFRTEGGHVLRATARDLRPTQTGAAVVIEAGTLVADRVVLAAGVWSRPLAERLGLRMPMESERGYHLTLHGPSRMPAFPFMIADKALVVTPMRSGLRLAGLVELGGLAAGPSKAPFGLIRRAVARVYPSLTWEGESEWMGHRPTTVDSLPVAGPVPGAPGILCAFGSQHLGLTIGPRLGRIVADLADGRPGNLDLAPYAPGRFRRRRV